MTSLRFDYRLSANCRAKNKQGSYEAFTVSNVFTEEIDSSNYNYNTSRNVAVDSNGDHMRDFIHDIMRPFYSEKVKAMNLDLLSVIIDEYTVESLNEQVVVFFFESQETNSTATGAQYIYAYWKQSFVTPENPKFVTSTSTDTSITLSWVLDEYQDGFRIYNQDIQLLKEVGRDVKHHTFTNLTRGRQYRFRITAFNQYGESTGTWIVVRALNPDFIPDRTDEDTNPFIYAEPDREGDVILPAFQSGSGDGMDLLVKATRDTTAREVFDYTMRVRGYEEQIIKIYPKREFQYRFTATDGEGAILAQTPWRLDILDGNLPLDKDGAGKQDIYLPIELEIPDTAVNVKVTVEVDDPEGVVSCRFDKGIAPTTDYQNDWITFFTKDSSAVQTVIRKPYYGAAVHGKGTYAVMQGETITIDDEFPSALYDPIFSTKVVKDWSVLVSTSNPNVRLKVIKTADDFMAKKKFLPIKITATIINRTQTPWNPLIHNGYYYMNQAEFFLYSESKVMGKLTGDVGYVPLNFTYSLISNLSFNSPGGHQSWVDQYKANFTGVTQNVTVEEGNIRLLDGFNTGTYISPIRQFNNFVNSYDPIVWDATTTYASTVKAYVANGVDADGNTVWKAVSNNQVPNIALSNAIQYKLELTAGEKRVSTVTDFTDTSNEDFGQGMLDNIGVQGLIDNVEVLEGYVLLDNLDISTGTFTSRLHDFGDNVDAFGELQYISLIPPDTTGGSMTVYTASSETGKDWDTVAWMPLQDVILPNDMSNPIVGTIASPAARYLKYKVDFTRSVKPTTLKWTVTNTAEWQTGKLNNITIWNDSIFAEDPTTNGVYISPVGHFLKNQGWINFAGDIQLPANGGNVVIKTISSDDPIDLSLVTENDSRWKPLNGAAIASPVHDYLVYKAEIIPGTDVDGNPASPIIRATNVDASGVEYMSPLLYEVMMDADTYEFQSISPIVTSVQVGGNYNAIKRTESYTQSFASQIPYDGKLKMITTTPIATISSDALKKDAEAKYGVPYDQITVTGYKLEVNSSFGVSLTSRDKVTTFQYDEANMGKGYIFAQTTNIAEEQVYDQLRIKADKDNEVLVTPAPQQGCPIVVQDGSGKELTRVSFYDDFGNLTLTFVEEIDASAKDIIWLSYLDVDPDTLVLETYNDNLQIWEPFTTYLRQGNSIKLPDVQLVGTTIRATYKILDSFTFDVNWDRAANYCKLMIHSSYINASENNSKELKISYETNVDSAYYVATDIDLNPLNNLSNAGFVYISRQSEPIAKLEMHITSDAIYADGLDTTWFRVLAKDKYGNPVPNEDLQISVNKGTLMMLSTKTDSKGMLIGKYTAPYSITPQTVTFTAYHPATRIVAKENITVRLTKMESRIYLEASQPTIKLNSDIISVTAYVYGENQEPIPNTQVTFKCPEGLIDTDKVMTNYHGEATILVKVTKVPEYGVLEITASEATHNLSTKTYIRIDGYYLYDEERIPVVNHFLDLPDYVKARENLGIYAAPVEPEAPQQFDLWIDQGDIKQLLKTYALRDVYSKKATRQNLGLFVGSTEPTDPTFTDVWIDKKK